MPSRPTRTRGRGKTKGKRPVTLLSHLCCCSCSCNSSPWRRRRRSTTGPGRREGTEMEIARAAAGVSCSKEHQRIYAEWFVFADPDGDGRVTGADATSFFGMSGLSRADLKQVSAGPLGVSLLLFFSGCDVSLFVDLPAKVWAIADSKRQGYLGFAEFVTAMQVRPRLSYASSNFKLQLVSLAQAGNEITQDSLKREDLSTLNPPVMEGVDELVAKSKAVVKRVHPDDNGTSKVQATSMYHWFGSKSAQKVQVPLSAVTSTSSDFDAKPMVMLLGQYSTGKTTFIKHMLKTSYPGAHVGPEPTTDRFVVVMSGSDGRTVPGNTIAVQADMPFTGLTTFGGAFLSKFECSQMPHPLLEHITFVDTPGVLSGEKQRTQRSYDFTGVTSWFAAKCDLILLLFDPHKLDISDEFKRVISSLRGHDDKIRVVLNKADQVDTQQLMRVYGALMWSLGKVLNTPEVVRVYIGSFNDKPVNESAVGPIGKDLFEREQDDLLCDLKDIPKKACDRRVNEFVKRARAAKIHAYIIGHLKKEMPAMMGKAKAQQRLIDNLEDEFAKVQREYHLPAGDFPDVEHFKQVLAGYSIDKFEKLKPKMVQAVDDMLAYDIPELLKNFRNPYE
ncbi:hypothetical protein HU200_003581 [Digitaria exilis]|uniref:Dynamin-type G domain-containing protein n=1 Tax=Digitaria exilis TaxID=1010633 RepID=A0A835FXF5_9POAL|nr:hypothetical protein HU200_003581 [Digitaria exilis]